MGIIALALSMSTMFIVLSLQRQINKERVEMQIKLIEASAAIRRTFEYIQELRELKNE